MAHRRHPQRSPWRPPTVAWLLVVAVTFGAAPQAQGAHALRVEGNLEGFFLTPDGDLGVHALQVTSHRTPKQGKPLHPLWSRYYFHVEIASPRPIHHVRLYARDDGALLYDRRIDEPQPQVRIPVQEDHSLGAHARHGLGWRAELRFGDGSSETVDLRVSGARLLEMPPLKIDWLALVRIEELRRFLREYGDEILPGLRADDVPFFLEGDGQSAVIDHPNVPPGAHEYKGPCPAPVDLHYGETEIDSAPPEVAGAVRELGGEATVGVPYDRSWYAIPARGRRGRSSFAAAHSVLTLLHEVCHALWGRKRGRSTLKGGPGVFEMPSIRLGALEAAELSALGEAVDAPPDKKRPLTHRFFALRDYRTKLGPATGDLVRLEDQLETDEGFAYFAAAKGAKAMAAKAEAMLLTKADPFFEGFDPRFAHSVRTLAPRENSHGLAWGPMSYWYRASAARGLAQALLLEDLDAEALHRVWTEGGLLSAALADASGYAGLRDDEKARLRGAVLASDEYQQLEAQIRRVSTEGRSELLANLRAGTSSDGIPLVIQGPIYGQAQPDPLPQDALTYLRAFDFPGENFRVTIGRPCLVGSVVKGDESGTLYVRTIAEGDSDLLRIRRPDDQFALKAKGVMLEAHEAKLDLGRGKLWLTVPPTGAKSENNSISTRGGGSAMKSKWLIVPLTLLALCNLGKAQLDSHDVAATATGLFENEAGQLVERTTEILPQRESGWYWVQGEEYVLTATSTDTLDSRVAYVAAIAPDGDVVAEETADPPVSTLTAQGTWVCGWFDSYKLGKGKFKVKYGPNGWSFWVEFPIGPEEPDPAKLELQVINGKTKEPFVGAKVSLYKVGQGEDKDWIRTDTEGKVAYEGLSPGDYDIEAKTDSPPGCHLKKSAFTLKAGWTVKGAVFVWVHKDMKGKIFFKNQQGDTVPGDPSSVTIKLMQGGEMVKGGTVSQQQNEDGSYDYTILWPEAGDYQVQAEFNGEQQEKPVTVPDDCEAECGEDEDTEALSSGPHELVEGPTFTFVINMGGPPGPGP